VLPFHDGKKGNPVIFSSFYRDQILKHKETEGCKEIVQQHRQHVVKVGITSPFVLQDVDTPSDYEKLKS
jgi:molybdenum cofactor cytidylyltransferase